MLMALSTVPVSRCSTPSWLEFDHLSKTATDEPREGSFPKLVPNAEPSRCRGHRYHSHHLSMLRWGDVLLSSTKGDFRSPKARDDFRLSRYTSDR
jgi:hypothetical protein